MCIRDSTAGVDVLFKETSSPSVDGQSVPKLVSFRIQPNPAIIVKYQNDPTGEKTVTVDLSNKSSLRAYGYLIRSAIEGRLEDFVCTDELLRAWEIIDPILDWAKRHL